MKDLQKIGAWSALIIAATYVFGFGLFMGFLDRTGYDGPSGDIAFVVDHQHWLSAAMIALYVLAGCALVGLVLAVHERLATREIIPNPIATAFGLIWAGIVIASGFVGLIGIRTVAEIAASDPGNAESAWIAISVVQDALGGGIELVGGVWLLIVSWLALYAGVWSRLMNYLGVAIGVLGIVTVVPGLGEFAALFGLTQIVWFVWVSVELLRHRDMHAAVTRE